MTELAISQAVRADPSTTYAAFTSADALARWWWPHIPDTTYAVDARAGGSYEIRSGAAGIGVRGEFLELEPPRSIGLTWEWLDDGVAGSAEDVRITLEPTGAGTLVRVEHECAPGSNPEDLRQGWHDVLDRLATLLEQR